MNNKIIELKKEINEKIENLRKQKEISGFKNIIDTLKSNGETILEKKIVSKNKKLSTKDERDVLLKEIEDLKKTNEDLSKKLTKITELEKKLFARKNAIAGQVNTLDRKRNTFDFKRVKLELEFERNENIISGKLKTDLEKEKTILLKKLTQTKKEIEEAKKGGFRTDFLESEVKNINKRIWKISIDLNKVAKTILDKVKNENVKIKKMIDENQKQSDSVQKEIDELVSIIKEINDEFITSKRSDHNSSFVVEHLDVWYGAKQALFDINVKFPKNKVISVIGPSGCGKSTFLRTLNRINDGIPSFKAKGRILLDGEYDIYKLKSIDNIYDKMELPTLRTKVGMIFQQPNPFPMSIAKNVQYGPKIKGISNKFILNELTENSLKDAGLWEEVRDNLKALGTSLSGGQQQRLCIARAIANEPEILLMDEPTSALDPIATKKIEDLIVKLKKNYTIIMVTHSMQQAQRISDHTAFFYQGELIEYGTTKQVFEAPKETATKDYISGKFG